MRGPLTLSDVATIIDCEHKTAPRASPGDEYGFSVGTGSLRAGRIDLESAKPVARATYDGWTGRCVPREGDLIFAREAPVGQVGVVPGRARVCLGQRTVLVQCIPAIVDSHYLGYRLQAPDAQRWMTENSGGSTVSHLNVSDVRRIPLGFLPQLTVQRRIVDILDDHLSRLDAAEALSMSAVRRLDVLQVSGLWRATHDVPESESLTLSDVAEVRLGRQRSPKNHVGDRMRPYLRAANVGWDELRLDDVKQMQFTESESATYELRDGDIMLTEASGSASEVGKSAVYRGEVTGACFQNTLLRVRCHQHVDPDFVQLYLLGEARFGKFVAESRGVGIHHLGRARLARWPIMLPTGDLQAAAVKGARDLAEATARARESTQAAMSGAHGLRRALLAAAFSGRLTGRSSDLEVAEELSVSAV